MKDCLTCLLQNSDFSTIKSLLIKFDLLNSVASLQNGTVFLPNNEAFLKIQDIIKTLTPDQIKNILLYHVSTNQVTQPGNNVLCALNNQPLLATTKNVNNVCIRYRCTNPNNTNINVIGTVLIPFNAGACS